MKSLKMAASVFFIVPIAALIASTFFLVSLSVQAAPSSSQLISMLIGYEWRMDEAKWRQFDSSTGLALINIANDSSQDSMVRMRAMKVMALFPNVQVENFLLQELRAAPNAVTKRWIFSALLQGFGQSENSTIENLAITLLGQNDPHLRIRAATWLSRFGQVAGREAVQRYLSNDIEPWERERSSQTPK